MDALVQPAIDSTPDVVDSVALARLYGEPLFALPQDLYIPPDALEVFLETFQGPLDLLLYLVRRSEVDVLDITRAADRVDLTAQAWLWCDGLRIYHAPKLIMRARSSR